MCRVVGTALSVRIWGYGRDGAREMGMGFIGEFVEPMMGVARELTVLSLQLRILERAMKLLKKDGRIVYSTCSMNPIENEAVVAAALQSNPGPFSV